LPPLSKQESKLASLCWELAHSYEVITLHYFGTMANCPKGSKPTAWKQAAMRFARWARAKGVQVNLVEGILEYEHAELRDLAQKYGLEPLTYENGPQTSVLACRKTAHSGEVLPRCGQRPIKASTVLREALEAMAEDLLLTVKEAAAILRLHENTLRSLLQSKSPPFKCIRPGERSIRILKSELDAYLAKGRGK
jgi:excisionase family DNA binding protein